MRRLVKRFVIKKRIDIPEFLQGKKIAVKVKEKDNACAWYSETIKGTA